MSELILPTHDEQLQLLAEYYSVPEKPVSMGEVSKFWVYLTPRERRFYSDWALVLYGMKRRKQSV